MDKKPSRLTIDEQFDLIALITACRGTCDRLRTGTVIRDKNNILIGGGYNGSLPGDPHCDDAGHQLVEGHCLRCNHGEENALLNSINLERIEGGVVTIVGTPCYPCARKLASKKPARIRFIGEYKNSQGAHLVKELCERRKIKLEQVYLHEVIATLQKALNFLQGPGGPFKGLPQIDIIRETNDE